MILRHPTAASSDSSVSDRSGGVTTMPAPSAAAAPSATNRSSALVVHEATGATMKRERTRWRDANGSCVGAGAPPSSATTSRASFGSRFSIEACETRRLRVISEYVNWTGDIAR